MKSRLGVFASHGFRFNDHWRRTLGLCNNRYDHHIDYFYASRLPGEPAGGIEDIHYHVFEPRTLRVSLSWQF